MDRNGISIWINAATLLVAPVLLYTGMKLGGMVGIIGAQAVLMIGNRLVPMFVVNRISAVRLPYTVGVRDLAVFYRESWSIARRTVRARLRGAAAASPGNGE